jgi:hypothetical protein
MASHHVIPYILSPQSLALYAADAPAGMVIEGTRRCGVQVLPFLSHLHLCLTFLYNLSSF